MKNRIIHGIKNHKIVVVSAASVLLLAGGGVTYAIAQNIEKDVASVKTTQERPVEEQKETPEQVEAPTETTPVSSPTVAPETSETPAPSPSSTPKPITLDSLTIEEIEQKSFTDGCVGRKPIMQMGSWSDEKWESMIREAINAESGYVIYGNANKNGSHFKHKVCIYWDTKKELLAN